MLLCFPRLLLHEHHHPASAATIHARYPGHSSSSPLLALTLSLSHEGRGNLGPHVGITPAPAVRGTPPTPPACRLVRLAPPSGVPPRRRAAPATAYRREPACLQPLRRRVGDKRRCRTGRHRCAWP